MTLLLNVAFGINVFAYSVSVENDQSSNQTSVPRNDIHRNESSKDNSQTTAKQQVLYKKHTEDKANSDFLKSEKNTLANYEKQKAAGKRFSTTTKALIGVGIAAAVIGIVVFAASRDKIKTF